MRESLVPENSKIFIVFNHFNVAFININNKGGKQVKVRCFICTGSQPALYLKQQVGCF